MMWKFLFLICIPVLEGKQNGAKRKIKVDREHLKFDFAGIFSEVAALFSNSDMDFQYFAAHDYDNNNKLDGLELFTALGHDSHHEHSESVKEENHNEDIEKQVDDIFEDHDGNDDGFLDFREFKSVQRVYPDLGGGGTQPTK